MAIKFRCPHCKQLLGISATKAGTNVDCPACGRTVNVPNEGGGAAKTEHTPKPGSDPGLRDALQELSALGSPTGNISSVPDTSKPAARTRKPPVTRSSGPQTESGSTDRDTMRIVPLANTHAAAGTSSRSDDVLSELVERHPAEDSAPFIEPEVIELDETETEVPAVSRKPPNDLTSALQELAAHSPAEPSQPAPPQASTRRSSLLPLMFTLPAFAVGLLLGTFWKSGDPSGTPKSSPKDAAAAVVTPPPAIGERQFAGVVRYIDAAGHSAPDAGAVVLLLPIENPTRLRLDARPLREPPDSKARQAVETALKILGGSVHQADADGNWEANVPSDIAMTVTIISLHRSRSETQPVPPGIRDSLDNWFESPLHIVGRLSVIQTIVPAGSGEDYSKMPPIETEFTSGT